ncbi:MAG: WD40 repeat domain-containing protein [Planctomycetia bacterium]|nr:WD40 repeat domain-containing protein [Planctomycetia bacterium]
MHVWDDTPDAGTVRHELGSPGLALAHRTDGSAVALTADACIWTLAAEPGSRPTRTWCGEGFTAQAAVADISRDRFAWASAAGTVLIAEPSRSIVTTSAHAPFVDGPTCMVFSPSGSRLAILGRSPADPLLVVDARSGDEIARVTMPWTIQPAGVAWVDDDTLFAGSFAGAHEVRRQPDGRWLAVRSIPGSFYAVRGLTPAGTVLAADMSGFIVERDLSDGHEVRHYARVSDMASCSALSPDARLMAAAGTDRRLHVFDRQSGEQLLSLLGHQRGRRVMAIDFSAGGDRVLTLDNGGGIAVWDTRPPTAHAIVTRQAQ